MPGPRRSQHACHEGPSCPGFHVLPLPCLCPPASSILLMWPLCEPWVMLPSGHPGCELGCHMD